jgi:5-deoxy-glucuronate isomerase
LPPPCGGESEQRLGTPRKDNYFMKNPSLNHDSRLVFRGTARHTGRKSCVTPQNSALQHLHYGRILLSAECPRVNFETERREVALICLSGECTVQVKGDRYELGLYDAIYVPRDSELSITTSGAADLVECSAEVEELYPLQVVRYASIRNDKSLCFMAGEAASQRELNVLIGNNVRAGRIVAGFTRSARGHWTSWPPHEHAELLEELYVFFDMPAPAFGVQFVYTDPVEPELCAMVRDGDAVAMPAGYHPNVAIPGHSVNFVWMMAARREIEDRVFGVVNVAPDFGATGSGLEAARGTR